MSPLFRFDLGKGSFPLPLHSFTVVRTLLRPFLTYKVNDMISQIHPIPSYDDPAALSAVIDRMEQVGIHLMYDMRLYVLLEIL